MTRPPRTVSRSPSWTGSRSRASPGVWGWNIYRVGRDDNGEEVWLLRLSHSTGISELWAPATFWKEFAEKVALQMSGLYIARGDIPPEPPQ